jgi:hypothetical protein
MARGRVAAITRWTRARFGRVIVRDLSTTRYTRPRIFVMSSSEPAVDKRLTVRLAKRQAKKELAEAMKDEVR